MLSCCIQWSTLKPKVRNLRPSARIHMDSPEEFFQKSMDSHHTTKGPFILHCNCIVLLHRNCDVTALLCRIKVKFILTRNVVMLRWLVTESNQYIGTATQLQCSMNGPLVWKTERFMRINLDSCSLSCKNGFSDSYLIFDPETEAEQHRHDPSLWWEQPKCS